MQYYEPLPAREVELRHVDPSRDRFRRYHLAETRTLYGERGLLITWGRIGHPARTRLETFANDVDAAARWDELFSRRQAHGYRAQG